jgi:F0F1-type ATP synthase membrane subunit b/b'
MYINLTFILQIGNFLLTYWFLNKYFFKPFLTILEQKKHTEEVMQECLVQDEEYISNLKKEKEQRLIAFQDHIQSAYFVSYSQKSIEAPLVKFTYTHDDTVAVFLCMRKSIVKACDGA